MPILHLRKISQEKLAEIAAYENERAVLQPIPENVDEIIRQRFQLGFSRKAISKALGVSPEMVRDALVGVTRHLTETEPEIVNWETDLSLFP